MEFAYNNSYQSSIKMAPYEALYDCWYRSPIGWFELGVAKALELDLVQEVVAKVKVIRERMLAAQSRQKAYADHRRGDIEFVMGDMVFLKVSPMKGVMRFGKNGKLIPRYVRPYEVLVHDTLTYEETSIAILDSQVKRLCSRKIPSVKVLWQNQSHEEATWETEADMRARYPYLFTDRGNKNLEDQIS